MAVTLEYFDKCIEINGKGIPKSRIRYKFTGDTLKIWDDAKGEFNPEIEGLAYGQITNNNALPAPAPFAALADLKSYIRDNFFFDVSGGGSTGAYTARLTADAADELAGNVYTASFDNITITGFVHCEDNLVNGGTFCQVINQTGGNRLIVDGLAEGNIIIVFGLYN